MGKKILCGCLLFLGTVNGAARVEAIGSVTVYDNSGNFIGSYTTIQEGINACPNEGTVTIAGGIYTGTENKNLSWSNKHITVKSQNGPENCIIDCQNSGRGFNFGNSGQNSSDVINGFTIRNAKNPWTGGNHPDGCGGGILCWNECSPTITNCIITNNAAQNGGGIYCYHSCPTITNCIITSNIGYGDGGGISCDGAHIILTNCIITNNTALDSGGISCFVSSPTITNCIITNNIASREGGGIYCNASCPTITYSNLWNNSPENYKGINNSPENYQTEINGNISADPKFINEGDYHFLSISSCIDRGSNTVLAISSTDLDGNPRIVNGTVDMGAYEYQGSPTIAYINILPTAGVVSTIVTISGVGFYSTELIQMDFGTSLTITTVSTVLTGSFTTTFTIDTQPYGTTTIRATGLNSSKTAETVFCLLPRISMVVPSSGTVGTMVTISGDGFAKVEGVSISFDTTPNVTQGIASTCGTFTTTFTVDTQPYGTTTICACGNDSGGCAAATFFIQPNIIFVTPSSGTIGSFVTVAGNGYRATELVCIDFGTTRTIQLTSTYAEGNFTTIFTIDTQPYGITTIVVTGVNSNARAYATFTILPNIILVSPSRGTVGSFVTIRGNGFGQWELICIRFGMTPTIQSVSTYAQGSFTTYFTINTQPYGTTTIRAVGVNTQAEDSDSFFILPNIILLTPYQGTVGSCVTMAGNGFGQMEEIRIDFGTTMAICNVTSTAYGSFSALFTINSQPYGITSIVALGLITSSRVYALFTIVPKIILSPTAGQIGSMVRVSGNGFEATELIRIEFGTTPTITSATTNAFGGFEVTFTVDSQPIGTTTITAYGLMTDIYAQTTFYILPTTLLKITPAIQNIGVNSTFTCQVEIENVSELAAGDLYISYDSNILEVTRIGTGTFPPNCSAVSKITAGKIDYSFGLFSGSATGSGILCFLHFKAIAGGTSSVRIDTTQDRKTILLKIDIDTPVEIPFTKEDAIYYVISKIKIKPQDKIIKADEDVEYQCIGECGSGLALDVTGSTTFTSNGGGSFTLNTFLAKYMSTYTIQGEYLGFIGTTSVIILPGTPTTLVYVSGNGQVNTCTFTLKDPFIVKVVDKYENPCQNVEVKWEIISTPSGATGYSISPTKTTTNVQGTVSSFLTLGTEPPGTYTIHAISTGLSGSPCIFTAHSLRRFGNIAGFCLLKLGTVTLGTCSDIEVRIVELSTTTTTNDDSYFIFENIPVGTYTLNFDTWGASPSTKTNICISPTQFEDTTYIGTITLLAGDVNNDGQVNIGDWPLFADAWREKATKTHTNWNEYKEADFNHDSKVDAYDFIVIRNNFGEQQKGRVKELIAMSTKAKKTSGKIELSFDLETLEGVDIDELRVGNIIYLKIYVRDAKDYLGGEIHLAFNPKVLQVIDADNSKDGIQIQPGDFPQGSLNYTPVELKNEVDNLVGKIDYAVAVWEPEQEEKGILAIVPFKVISCGAYSKVNFEFDDEENRETMFIERIGQEQPVDQQPEILPDEVIIKVPAVFNNLQAALVYPNPAYKGQEVTFTQITTDKQVTLRIYNIAGELVIEKQKDNINDSQIKWNLKNKDNEYVASGIYIYFLKDEPGSIKKGKIGVIK
ncbi:MAG: choice-of-anchor Q domain-containing protein [bacterium]